MLNYEWRTAVVNRFLRMPLSCAIQPLMIKNNFSLLFLPMGYILIYLHIILCPFYPSEDPGFFRVLILGTFLVLSVFLCYVIFSFFSFCSMN